MQEGLPLPHSTYTVQDLKQEIDITHPVAESPYLN